MEIRKFEIYHEKNRYKGAVEVEYIAYARDREEVLLLGEEQGIFFDIDDYTIEDCGVVRPHFGRLPEISLTNLFES